PLPRLPLRPPLFPYTPLFRSQDVAGRVREAPERLGFAVNRGLHALLLQVRDRPLQVVRDEADPRDPANHLQPGLVHLLAPLRDRDRKSTRLNSSHEWSSYAVF